MASPKSGAHAGSEHRDPVTHVPGAHPVGVGAGAASAGAAGAALGAAVAGPLGAVVGAAVGAVAGGLGGKAAAEAVNPTIEDVGATSAETDGPDRSATGAREPE
jgi:outer membrane lipoprotein SlyB